MVRCRSPLLILPALLGLSLLSPAARAAKPPDVRELRFQKVGDTVFFHVRFAMPRHMLNDGREFPRSALPWAVDETSLEPRLVPQDGEARAVYRRPPTPENGPAPRADSLPGTATFSGATVPERKDLAPGDKKEAPPPQPRQ